MEDDATIWATASPPNAMMTMTREKMPTAPCDSNPMTSWYCTATLRRRCALNHVPRAMALFLCSRYSTTIKYTVHMASDANSSIMATPATRPVWRSEWGSDRMTWPTWADEHVKKASHSVPPSQNLRADKRKGG